MTLDPNRLRLVEDSGSKRFEGTVWRATFETRSPVQPNVRGARWNPPDVSALYSSLDERTVRAEWTHLLDSQPVRPDAKSVVVQLEVSINDVVDLRDVLLLESLGIDPGKFPDDMHLWGTTRDVGEAVEWLGLGGMLVPSARHPGGSNLVIFTRNVEATGFDWYVDVTSKAW
jgi:RES domain-containing protein